MYTLMMLSNLGLLVIMVSAIVIMMIVVIIMIIAVTMRVILKLVILVVTILRYAIEPVWGNLVLGLPVMCWL